MKRSRNSLFASLLMVFFCEMFVLAQTPGHGLDLSAIDKSTNPCQDFYQYANGNWLAKNPIPPAYPAWGVANVLSEQNLETLHQIAEAAAHNTRAPKGSNEQKVGDYYAACMAEDKIEAEGIKPIQSELDRIAGIKDARGLTAEFASLNSVGFNVPFGSSSVPDFKNASEVIFGIGAGWACRTATTIYARTTGRRRFETSTSSTSQRCSS